jgi:hypothetical protein
MENLIVSYMSLLLVNDCSGGGPIGRDLVSHSYTSVDYILIEIIFSCPINVLQIFELLFHGHICYEYWWIMLLYVLTLYIITICLCILVVEDKLQVYCFESSAQLCTYFVMLAYLFT